MFFKQQLLTKNDCYRANRQIRIKGLMLHSTGATGFFELVKPIKKEEKK